MLKAAVVTSDLNDSLNTTEPYRSRGEIENLISAFEACTLPKSKWTHQAHLIVALWHNLRYSPGEALNLVRERITRYNESVGTQNTETSGYHETITVLYMWAVRKYIEGADSNASIVEIANRLLGGRLAEKNFPFEYYSRELLLSPEARRHFVEPDLQDPGSGTLMQVS
jgi:hypothetical protein